MAGNVKRLAVCAGILYSSAWQLKPIEKPKYKMYSAVHLRSVSRNW
jgi:hypothetical protein